MSVPIGNSVKTVVRLFFIASIVAVTASAQRSSKPLRVGFCELASHPMASLVRVSGTYRYSFEHSVLYCLSCEEDAAWVDFDDSYAEASPHRLVKLLKDKRYTGRTLNVVLDGKFETGVGYGHFGMYKHRFVVHKIISAKVVENQGVSISVLTPKQRSKVCQ